MNEPTAAATKPSLLLALSLIVTTSCTARESPPAPDAGHVGLSVADRPAYDAVLARERGQVVLVDFWALWCEPCVDNFPHVIELADRHWTNGLKVVTVSLDAPEAAEKVLAFLRSQRSGAATNLISQYGAGTKSMTEFEIPGGGVPCYRLYDRRGQLRHTFSADPAAQRSFTLQDLDASVEKLLAE